MFVKDCMPCIGLGYYGEDAGDACQTCQGSGKIELEGTRTDYQSCWLCCGTGYGGISVRSACRTCMGTGLYALDCNPRNDQKQNGAKWPSWLVFAP